ncbi:hypothetical protein PFISCL1PPCAC_20094, partial [Pristionchus fissidentatus]
TTTTTTTTEAPTTTTTTEATTTTTTQTPPLIVRELSTHAPIATRPTLPRGRIIQWWTPTTTRVPKKTPKMFEWRTKRM